jgi:uncharacterized protein (TIGR02147 family)
MQETERQKKYQDYLLSEFESRRISNPRYSLRAYARDLGIAPPKLSEILREKSGLSEVSAKRIAPKIGLTKSETDVFVTLVASKHSRSSHLKKRALEKLKNSHELSRFKEMSFGVFDIVSDWYFNAILELTETVGFKSDISWIAKKLHLPEQLISDAVKKLMSLNLLAKNKENQWYQTEQDLATPSEIPSSSIRRYHRQILMKAADALSEVPVTERDFSAMTFAIPESKLAEGKQAIKEFRRKFAADMSKSKIKERVYCLSIQFFPLERKDP